MEKPASIDRSVSEKWRSIVPFICGWCRLTRMYRRESCFREPSEDMVPDPGASSGAAHSIEIVIPAPDGVIRAGRFRRLAEGPCTKSLYSFLTEDAVKIARGLTDRDGP